MHNYVIERKWTLMISQNMHLQRPTQRSRVGHDVFTLVVFPVPAGYPKIEVQHLNVDVQGVAFGTEAIS